MWKYMILILKWHCLYFYLKPFRSQRYSCKISQNQNNGMSCGPKPQEYCVSQRLITELHHTRSILRFYGKKDYFKMLHFFFVTKRCWTSMKVFWIHQYLYFHKMQNRIVETSQILLEASNTILSAFLKTSITA